MNNLRHSTAHKNPNALKRKADTASTFGNFHLTGSETTAVTSRLPVTSSESSGLPRTGTALQGTLLSDQYPQGQSLGPKGTKLPSELKMKSVPGRSY